MHRSYWCIQKYIAKDFLFSFFVAFLFFFFIFFVNQILLLAEEILSKQVPFFDVVLLIVYSLPAIVSISFPFASLVGALMTIGSLSSENEVLALQSCGIPHRALFLPLLILGVVFSLFSFTMNDYFLPVGTINFQKLYRKVLYANPELELESYSVKRYQDSIIITGEVQGREINDILIIDRTDKKDRRIITARKAFLLENQNQKGVIALHLQDVFSHTALAKRKTDYEYFTADQLRYNILLRQLNLDLRNPGPREMSSVDVYNIIKEKRLTLEEKESSYREKQQQILFELSSKYYGFSETASSPSEYTAIINHLLTEYRKNSARRVFDRSLQIYSLEFHKKFSIPFGCLAFVLFAFPTGLFTKRSGRSVGFGLGLFISIAYWGMLFAGQPLGIRMDFSPLLAMWLPNIVIVFLGLILSILRFRT